MVNIYKNYMNYIQSNPKIVLPIDDLEVAETGTTEHYLTLDLPCSNKQKAVHPLPIQIPNGEIIKSMHTALLSHSDMPLQARKAHLFPGLTKGLLYIGTFFDHGCEATFNENYVHIKNKHSVNIIMMRT